MITVVIYTEIPYSSSVTEDRFDPVKDAANREKHRLPLAFGDRIFEDANHLIIPSVREIDGEERFKAVGIVGDNCSRASSCGASTCLASSPSERATMVKKKPIALPSDPADAEDFDVSAEALDRGQRARLIRTTRTGLGLSQSEFAGRFRVPVGTLRDWEQARVSPPDFAIAYVRVIGRFPEMVAKAVA